MEITIDLEQKDWGNYQSYIERALSPEMNVLGKQWWVNVLIWAALTVFFMFLLERMKTFDWPTAIFVATIFIIVAVLFVVQLVRARKAFLPAEDGVFCGRHTFVFSEQGIASRGHGYQGVHSWDLVRKIVRAQGMILIFLDTVYAYVLPESKLTDPDKLFEHVNTLHRAATARTSP